MDYKQILKDLKNKVFHPVYFLCGAEPYYIDLISDYIENNVLSEAEKEFNQTVLYGKETDIVTIVSEAKRFPMMANHNVVIVKEAQHLSNDINNIQSYIENPSPTTILVFCYKYKTIDKRKTIGKLLQKKSVFLETKKLYDNQLPPWITDYVKGKGYNISQKAAILLADYLGADLTKIANEVNKLVININKGDTITDKHIEENIGISREFNNFELNNAIRDKNILKANQIINYFAQNPKQHSIHATFSVLYSFFTKILLYHYTPDKSKNNIASTLKVNPFFVNDYQKAAQNYSAKKVVKIVEYLHEYDLKSKGIENTSVPESELYKELIFKIMH